MSLAGSQRVDMARKISGTGGTELSGAILFQGTVLVNVDVDEMLRSLRIPTEKLQDKEIESADVAPGPDRAVHPECQRLPDVLGRRRILCQRRRGSASGTEQ